MENVRSLLGTSFKTARRICESATRSGQFKKKYGVICPNDECGRIIKSYDKISEIEEAFNCDTCEDLERDLCKFSRDECEILEYYQLVTNA
ncbi:hypothetical protein [Aquimarina hainanensis]|uniref:hypothetical protein n=1 Tax=Aquimarina hainanensis TaxID=1578017 RepID=UPI003605D610